MKLKQLIEDLQQLIKNGVNPETYCLFKEVKEGVCYSIESIEIHKVDEDGFIRDEDDTELENCENCVVFESWG